MKIAIASDHGGYQLKEEIKKYLEGRNIEVVDRSRSSPIRTPEYINIRAV